jgi:hypothetical protein
MAARRRSNLKVCQQSLAKTGSSLASRFPFRRGKRLAVRDHLAADLLHDSRCTGIGSPAAPRLLGCLHVDTREFPKPAVSFINEPAKRCCKCEKSLSLAFFYLSSKSPDGRQCICKDCLRKHYSGRARRDLLRRPYGIHPAVLAWFRSRSVDISGEAIAA